MSKAMAMSSHCSGCGSIELALRFIVAAWANGAFPFQLRTASCCVHPLVERALRACPLTFVFAGSLPALYGHRPPTIIELGCLQPARSAFHLGQRARLPTGAEGHD